MRVEAVFRREDFIPAPGSTTDDADRFFEGLSGGIQGYEIARDHAGMAIVALSPRLAMQMGAMSKFLALELPFSERTDLRELAIQTAHLLSGCGFALESRFKACIGAGLSPEQLASLATWESSSLFDEEQRLVLEYAEAVYNHAVDDDLLARYTSHFGQASAVECAAVVGYWSCWAMIINMAQP